MAQDGEIRQHPNGGTYIRQGGVWVLQGAAPAAPPAMAGGAPTGILGTIPGAPKAPPPQRPIDAALDQQQLTNAALEGEAKRLAIAEAQRKAAASPGGEKLARIPANAATAIQNNKSTLRRLQHSLERLQSRPQSIGPGTGMLGDTFTQFNDPEGTDVRAAVGEVGGEKIHDLSGAAVSASEMPRFVPFVPKVTDRPEVAKKKLEGFRREMEAVLKEQEAFYSPTNGYRPYVGASEGQFGSDEPDTAPGREMTAEQRAAYDALVASGANADQIRKFGDAIGMRIENADKVTEARDKGRGARGAADAVYNVPEETTKLKEAKDQVRGAAGAESLLMQGATFGLADEASGVGNVLANATGAALGGARFDPLGAYQAGKGSELLRVEDARDSLGAGGVGLEVLGGFAGANPGNVLARLPTLMSRVGQSARVGAEAGALSGYGNGEGATGSVLSGLGGGIVGGAIGAAIPVAGAVIGGRVNGMRSMMGRSGETAARAVRGAFEADGVSPARAGQIIDAAQSRGVPAMLADVGENLRNLLASVTRQPGPSRRIGLEAVTNRQVEQAERIEAAIRRDLGSTANPHEVSEQLSTAARVRAAPLYDRAYAAPGASSVDLTDLATRPAFRSSIQKAHSIIKEEGGDPTALGFDLDEAGEVVLTRVPSWQTLDYVKRGMDDVVYASRNPLTGAPNLDNQSRAINNTRRMLVSRMDAINPTYAEARAAWAGPTSAKEALDRGLKAVNRSAADITAETARMTPYELDHYRLGVRRGMADLIAGKGDYADKIHALTGTPKKRAALQRLFGGQAGFDNFLATLGDERAAQITYNRAATGSPTALNQAVDLLSSDTGLAETAMDTALRGAKDGVWSTVISLIQRARQAEQLGAGRAGEEARESIAALLVQTDPVQLRQVMRAAGREIARRRVTGARNARITRGVATGNGELAGRGVGALLGGPQRAEQPAQ